MVFQCEVLLLAAVVNVAAVVLWREVLMLAAFVNLAAAGRC